MATAAQIGQLDYEQWLVYTRVLSGDELGALQKLRDDALQTRTSALLLSDTDLSVLDQADIDTAKKMLREDEKIQLQVCVIVLSSLFGHCVTRYLSDRLADQSISQR